MSATAGPDRCRVASQELPLSERGLETLYRDKSLKIHAILAHEDTRHPGFLEQYAHRSKEAREARLHDGCSPP